MEAIIKVRTTITKKQEVSNKAPMAKDPVKRPGDSLHNEAGKKRILGDITNRSSVPVTRSQKSLLRKEDAKKPAFVSVDQLSVPQAKLERKDSLLVAEPSDSAISFGDSPSMYLTASEDSAIDVSSTVVKQENKVVPRQRSVKKPLDLPAGVRDFDAQHERDPFNVGNYAADIFKYYREREAKFRVPKYLDRNAEVTRVMRAVLVDWMVEVQESFELNHETLYLAVRLVDLYLAAHRVPRATLQLLGATCVFVASKFDERLPPLVDDFLYICDDSYTREQLLRIEINILKTVNFDLGMPLSYRFLRRYARCGGIPMDLLTLARFILETSLMDYELVDAPDSRIAAAALLLALKMKSQEWTPALEYYSGYSENDLTDLLFPLNKNISGTANKALQTIRTKYSHTIFFEVAKVPPLVFKAV